MNILPANISVDNKENFTVINIDRLMCLLRLDIYSHMLWNDENNFYDLDKFCKEKLMRNTDMLEKMLDIIMKEIVEKGWKCKLSYGNTALFIYSSAEQPPGCW